MIGANDIDEAAVRLAVESRSLLGLPEAGPSCFASSKKQGHSWIRHQDRPPTSLQFAQILNRHVPVLFDGCMRERACTQRWQGSQYLIDAMGPNRPVRVAVTPNGRADDVHLVLDGQERHWNDKSKTAQEVFVLPHERSMTFHELIDALRKAALDEEAPVVYLQSQNSNLMDDGQAEGSSGDLSPLLRDLQQPPRDPQNGNAAATTTFAWADEAMGKQPEATNLWIGTAASRTSMHRDHYENLFTVIKGTKIFTLYPPCEAHFLCDDRPYDVYEWQPPSDDHDWQIVPSKEAPPTPWIPIDPSEPASSPRNRRYPRFAKALAPLVVEVHSGETLYLPAGWYHHVAQRGESGDEPNGTDDDLCVCVNWWYESDYAFSDRWALETFVKEVGQLSRGETVLGL